ncbi:MAG: hypothetical protein ACOY32_06605 [Thermodesulfobacteriota bacterium]
MQKVETLKMPVMPMSQIVYGEVVYWITILAAIITIIGPALALIFTENNVMNPVGTLTSIFAGMSPAEVWANSKDGAFPGGHFYLSNLFTGDGFTQFGIALGCGVALPGLLASSLVYMKDKAFGFVALSLWVAALVFLSASGLVNIH